MPDGSLLVVSMKNQRVLRRDADGTVSLHADVSDLCGGNLNDMVVSAGGHAYAGNFGFDLMAGADPQTAEPDPHRPGGQRRAWPPRGWCSPTAR